MMGRSFTKRRVLVVSAALALAAPLTAQQPQSGPDEQQLRYQLQTFEGVLQSAVRHGGDTFARDQASVIPPGIQLTSDDPQAFGFAPPESGGLFFLVVVPPLRVTVEYLVQRQPFVRPQVPAASQGPMQNVAGAPPPGGGVVSPMAAATPADPMKVSPVVDEGRCAVRAPRTSQSSNPNREYAVAVCDALMDAMLDYSGPLPVKEEEWLTIAAIDGTGGTPGVLNSPYSYTTYLQIRGSDLVALRQGKISKSEARKLVSLKQR
jgi:hypothetical protein